MKQEQVHRARDSESRATSQDEGKMEPGCAGASPIKGEHFGRREVREEVELLARLRRNIASTTVMLRDLTPHGARVEGVGRLETDEVISLSLPGRRPAMAFVAWANGHGAGLEFAEPLDGHVYADIVARHGRQPHRPCLTPAALLHEEVKPCAAPCDDLWPSMGNRCPFIDD